MSERKRRTPPLAVIRLARNVQSLPDGRKIPTGAKHALVTLATYWPDIFPSQEQLAADMSIDRSNVNRRLKVLEGAGLITRVWRPWTSTRYRLHLAQLHRCSAPAALSSTNDTASESAVDGGGDYLAGF